MRKILTSLLLMFFLFMGRNVCCQQMKSVNLSCMPVRPV